MNEQLCLCFHGASTKIAQNQCGGIKNLVLGFFGELSVCTGQGNFNKEIVRKMLPDLK